MIKAYKFKRARTHFEKAMKILNDVGCLTYKIESELIQLIKMCDEEILNVKAAFDD